jgi:hypothetical protein
MMFPQWLLKTNKMPDSGSIKTLILKIKLKVFSGSRYLIGIIQDVLISIRVIYYLPIA